MPMDASPLQNQVVFVTGGSRGIGKALVRRFASAGAKVAFCARDVSSLHHAEEEIRSLTPHLYAFQADVSDADAIRRGVEAIRHTFGPITILVNNAGIYRPGSILETSLASWQDHFRVNLKGLFLVTQAVVPQMIENGGGRILFISSTIAQISPPQNTCYTATKWGLEGFAGCIAQELLEHHVNVHVLRPGFTATSIFDEIGKPDGEIDWIDPDEIAAAAEFLCRLPPHAQVPELTYMTSFQRSGY